MIEPSTPIDELDLSVRTKNILKQAGFKQFDQIEILNPTFCNLLGNTALDEIKNLVLKSNETHAVYGASFDPITNGHLWVIQQGASLFKHLTIAMATNADKHYMFSDRERADMVAQSILNIKNVDLFILQPNELLATFASEKGIKYLLRGVRSPADYEYEKHMIEINRDISPNLLTVLLFCPAELAKISSSTVKGIWKKNGWEKIVANYVPQPVYQKLTEQKQ